MILVLKTTRIVWSEYRTGTQNKDSGTQNNQNCLVGVPTGTQNKGSGTQNKGSGTQNNQNCLVGVPTGTQNNNSGAENNNSCAEIRAQSVR